MLPDGRHKLAVVYSLMVYSRLQTLVFSTVSPSAIGHLPSVDV
jgi:hypothetical protein